MKALIGAALFLLLLSTIGCGGQGNSNKAKAKPPAVDLHTAVVLNNLEAIRQHIEAGSDLNVLEPTRSSTPLITAAALGKTEAAKLLIEAGADLNYQNDDGSTALHTAAFLCRPEIVQALLSAGADKTLKNKTGMTALQAMELPFEQVKGVYDGLATALRPAGIVLDYEYIETTRPKIAEMLR